LRVRRRNERKIKEESKKIELKPKNKIKKPENAMIKVLAK